MDTLSKIYSSHHTDTDRHSGFKMHGDERGVFLRSVIGTDKDILDIGCRDGSITAQYSAGNRILGIDIDPIALAKCPFPTKVIDLNADWDVGKFDIVVATEVIEHLYFPDKVLGRVKQSLRPGGVFTGSVPNAFSLINRLRYLRGQPHFTPLDDPTHINQFSHHTFKALLERHFSEVTIVPFGKYARLDKYHPGFFSFMLQFTAKI